MVNILQFFLLLLILLMISSCDEQNVVGPEVGQNQVGIINNLRVPIHWGIRYSNIIRTVDSKGTDLLSYSDKGYWVSDYNWTNLFINAGNGQTIEAYYIDSDNWGVRIK